MKPPIQAGMLVIALAGLLLAGCQTQGRVGAAPAPGARTVSPGLLRGDGLGPPAADWAYGRRDSELGSIPGSIPPYRDDVEIRSYDRQYTVNGRVRGYSRTITRSIRRAP